MKIIEFSFLFSYNKQFSLNTQLMEKNSHLTQLYETESKLKWEYFSQVEQLSEEVRILREQLRNCARQHYFIRQKTIADEESNDLKRIKKVNYWFITLNYNI